jgi:hypothetical protein
MDRQFGSDAQPKFRQGRGVQQEGVFECALLLFVSEMGCVLTNIRTRARTCGPSPTSNTRFHPSPKVYRPCTCAGACKGNVFGACHPWRGACSRPSVPGYHMRISRSRTQNGPRWPGARGHGLPLHLASTPLCGWPVGSPCVPVGNG